MTPIKRRQCQSNCVASPIHAIDDVLACDQSAGLVRLASEFIFQKTNGVFVDDENSCTKGNSCVRIQIPETMAKSMIASASPIHADTAPRIIGNEIDFSQSPSSTTSRGNYSIWNWSDVDAVVLRDANQIFQHRLGVLRSIFRTLGE